MADRDEKGYFQKGNQVAKGKGRTKGALSINDAVRKILATKDVKTKRKILDAVAQQVVTQAIKGDRDFNPTMMIQLWQQMDGKPNENVNIGGQEDNPIQINIRHVKPDIEKGK